MEPLTLGRGRTLYILPTREGMTYAALLLVTLLAGVNYANGLAYALTFLLGAIGIVTTVHTHRNLAGLRLSAGAATPVFAGETAQFTVVIYNDTELARHAIDVISLDQTFRIDVSARGATTVTIAVPTRTRGYLAMPTVAVRSVFPLGIWRTWSRTFDLRARCLVYPMPGDTRPLPEAPADDPHAFTHGNTLEGDDFAGLREYHTGDSLQRVAWKKVAADQGWYTKQFAVPASPVIWLDWNFLPDLELEKRLSVMCRWVLTAEMQGVAYGMRLPGEDLAPGRGTDHRDRCLARLALYRAPA
jgi:uncharacterized protein (DUF58 family)